jgi:hypothetical protein
VQPSPPVSAQLLDRLNEKFLTCQTSTQSTSIDLSFPPGLKRIRSYSVVSPDTISILKATSEILYHAPENSEATCPETNLSHQTLMYFEMRVYGQALIQKSDVLSDWLLWGIIALIFQCYSYTTRLQVRHQTFERLNAIVKPPPQTPKRLLDQDSPHNDNVERASRRRDCAIWTLMCLAGASSKRRADDGVTHEHLEGPVDRASSTLINSVKTLLRPGSDQHHHHHHLSDWERVELAVKQFWCPNWMLKEWKEMWNEAAKDDKRAPAYYRVYHHWHMAIRKQDVFI